MDLLKKGDAQDILLGLMKIGKAFEVALASFSRSFARATWITIKTSCLRELQCVRMVRVFWEVSAEGPPGAAAPKAPHTLPKAPYKLHTLPFPFAAVRTALRLERRIIRPCRPCRTRRRSARRRRPTLSHGERSRLQIQFS